MMTYHTNLACGIDFMRAEEYDHALERIDAGLEDAASITIEQALERAVEAGRMTIKEAEECLEAYIRAFHNDQ